MREYSVGLLLVVATTISCSSSEPAQKPSAARFDEPEIRSEPSGAFSSFSAELKDIPADAAGALTFLRRHAAPLHRDCVAGSQLACVAFVQTYQGMTQLAQSGRAKLVPQLKSGCTAGDEVQCAAAAEALDDPSGTSTMTRQAIGDLMKVCERGMQFACGRAASVLSLSGLEHPALGRKAAQSHIERACEAGFTDACSTLVTLAGAAPSPEQFSGSAQHRAMERACRAGDIDRCDRLVTLVAPEPPFGCSVCDAQASGDQRYFNKQTGMIDERCRDCDIAQCQRDNCCPTCGDRKRNSCCIDGGNPAQYPDQPPAADTIAAAQAARLARDATAGGRALWREMCKRGAVPAWCEPLAALDEKVRRLAPPQR